MQNRDIIDDIEGQNDDLHEDLAAPEGGDMLDSQPPALPKIEAKSGYKTSQGQITVLFGLLAAVLSLTGVWKGATPEKIDNAYQMINHLLEVLGPVFAYIPILIAYINSRGKIQSNSLWASASLSTGVGKDGIAVGSPATAQFAGLSGGKLGKIIGGITTGIRVGGAVGLPGMSQANSILDEIGGGQPAQRDSDHQYTDTQIRGAFENHEGRIVALEKK